MLRWLQAGLARLRVHEEDLAGQRRLHKEPALWQMGLTFQQDLQTTLIKQHIGRMTKAQEPIFCDGSCIWWKHQCEHPIAISSGNLDGKIYAEMSPQLQLQVFIPEALCNRDTPM